MSDRNMNGLSNEPLLPEAGSKKATEVMPRILSCLSSSFTRTFFILYIMVAILCEFCGLIGIGMYGRNKVSGYLILAGLAMFVVGCPVTCYLHQKQPRDDSELKKTLEEIKLDGKGLICEGRENYTKAVFPPLLQWLTGMKDKESMSSEKMKKTSDSPGCIR